MWVVSGDYKRDPDPTCQPFEPVPCDVFISEATFALPAYRWAPTGVVAAEILEWWQGNRARGKASVLFASALGKAQRVLAELTRFTAEPAYLHGSVATRAMVIAPPSAAGSTWMRHFGDSGTGFCSGWMRVRSEYC